MNLSDAFKASFAGIREECGLVREDATAIGHAVPGMSGRCTAIMQRCITILAHVNHLEAMAGEARMAGKLEPGVPQNPVGEMPLFATTSPAVASAVDDCHRQMIRTLHRAGDHTLDETNS